MSQQADLSTPSLGGIVLRKTVLDAARCETTKCIDPKGIIWLEHLNLVVGSHSASEMFYVEYLGLSNDTAPYFHLNLGQQQFHLFEDGSPAQRITGSIGLVVPNLSRVRERTAAATKALGKTTQFRVVDDSSGCMTVICPDGNRMHLYDARDDGQIKRTSDSMQLMTRFHVEGGPYGPHRMSVRGSPGIRYIEISCRPGTTPAICQFYREMLQCTCTASTPTGEEPTGTCIVSVGPGVHLVYVEDESLSNDDIKRMEGVHICVYVSDFEGLYRRLKKRNLIWTNPRFTWLDTCDTWEEAVASRTLRFKDIIDLKTGEKVLELEHETRPCSHGQFLKVPVYEPK